MESPPASPEELAELERRIDGWLAAEAAENPTIEAVERGDGDEVRWFVRMRGDEKDVWTVWLTLGQRTLRFETFLMPSPEANREAVFEQLLRRNRKLTGLSLQIGEEEAVFLAGSLPVAAVDEAELDRILGSMWAAVELVFRPAVRLAFDRRPGNGT
ncbi:MAG: hypothetical protein GWN79_20960 [Actinobacteria bacterium]|nr:hypothetical protein [Actinomycetota bacterium]NIS34772.1 hypothetical protein [Actinomycetota bacterium]NIT97751.1 hypothetical protein [Actinomycetota bacterium]NIU21387.1 hypothetical protein [Actinomycetota bacterium]NIU69523.1 hypothetical protein [Actinomycetota bacterium]